MFFFFNSIIVEFNGQTNERRWLKEEDINYGRGIKKCRMKEFSKEKWKVSRRE